jgi:hypothetical protein
MAINNTPVELTTEELNIAVDIISNKLSMVSYERLWATLMACKYAINNNIKGDFVECGIWRGGNAIAAASIFKLYGSKKKVWLFDTFAGMTEPTEVDVERHTGDLAVDQYHNRWACASLEDVKNNFEKRNLLYNNIIFTPGDVCETLDIKKNIPNKICVLRLDTDWYESTKKELEILYPRLSIGGCLIVDDYGHWTGATKATDEYFDKNKNRPFFHYTDYTGRVGVKVSNKTVNTSVVAPVDDPT